MQLILGFVALAASSGSPLVLGAALAASSGSPPDGCASLVHGFSWPHSGALPHLSNVTDEAGCCVACSDVAACTTWTLHPASGCWLHGKQDGVPVAVPCGDHAQCISGARKGGVLPPVVPTAPPTPPPRPRPTALATPSAAHLAFHEDNLGAISHFGMQTFAAKSQRHVTGFAEAFPPSKFTPTQLDVDQWVRAAASFGAKYYVLVADHFSGFSLYPTTAHSYSIAHSPGCPSKNIIADFVAACLRHNVRPAYYYSVHQNWYYNVSHFTTPTHAEQAGFEAMALTQLEEIREIFIAGGAGVAEIWFDAGVMQTDGFVSRVNDFVSQKLKGATCHSCANMPDVDAVSWMGNENTQMSYPMWNANDENVTFINQKGKPFGIPDGTRWVPAHW